MHSHSSSSVVRCLNNLAAKWRGHVDLAHIHLGDNKEFLYFAQLSKKAVQPGKMNFSIEALRKTFS